MIQGGDPNSKESDQSKWGQGGTGDNLKAEFNNIKHDRGIVSMARSAHPDSASSQFFIVHDRHVKTLDEKYTVFGRIITQESYDTLDKIADLETKAGNIPLEVEKAEIKKTEVVTRSSLENILTLDAPERGERAIIEETFDSSTSSTITGDAGRYRNTDYGFSFTNPPGWMLQRGITADHPVLVALGVGKDGVTPAITFEALETNDVPFEEFFAPRLEMYRELDYGVGGGVLSEEHYTGANRISGKHGIVLVATQTNYQLPDTPDNVTQYVTIKFKQVILEAVHFHFVMTYVNHEKNFDKGLADFDNMISSFKTFLPSSQKFTTPESEVIVLDSDLNEAEGNLITPETQAEQPGGGCLIATATFGSEMAPQVQFLRELRDNTVLQTESGTSFMAGFNQFYYSFSPYIADYERENPAFKETVKLALTPLLTSLTLLQYADINSEFEMLGYGIGIILLNIGMYFGIPAVFIMKIRKLQ
jgi:peptidyl-prolyl cis-trans isomerase B (cyclophilin B)